MGRRGVRQPCAIRAPTLSSPRITPQRCPRSVTGATVCDWRSNFAAAGVRALSLPTILDSLHDPSPVAHGKFATAVRRQQTLPACVDWSHAIVTERERVLFRRLVVFLGASIRTPPCGRAADVAGRRRALDQLSLLGGVGGSRRCAGRGTATTTGRWPPCSTRPVGRQGSRRGTRERQDTLAWVQPMQGELLTAGADVRVAVAEA